MNSIPIIHMVVLIAAVWRLSNILAHKEEGPFRIFWFPHLWARKMARRHAWFKRSKITEGMECEYCNSIWFGTILGGLYLTFGTPVLYVIFPLALSTGAIIIKHIVFLIKSVDTRFDQQNQDHIAFKQLREQAIVRPDTQQSPAPGTPEWDALVFDQNISERSKV